MSTVTKNQHYVPQFLLRNFATRHGRTYRIHVFDTIRNDLRCNQNVADVCAQNYFYDNDNLVEKFLETNVETPAAAEIAALCSEGGQVAHFPSRAIARFITVQWARTAEAASQTLAATNGLIGTISQEWLRLNGFDEAAPPTHPVGADRSETSSRAAGTLGLRCMGPHPRSAPAPDHQRYDARLPDLRPSCRAEQSVPRRTTCRACCVDVCRRSAVIPSALHAPPALPLRRQRLQVRQPAFQCLADRQQRNGAGHQPTSSAEHARLAHVSRPN